MTRALPLWLAVGVAASACAPLTYSDAGAVDYETYRSVRVSVTSALDSVRATDYFAGELRRESGFERVTSDPAASVDAELDVTVSAIEEMISNDDGSTDTKYSSEANYRLFSPADSNVDSGTETDESDFEEEAIEDALDQVAAHFIRPYRL
ncbi:MAG TPA: hypothetical protein VF103_03610 [Polyangiaceae bacterium]